MPELPSAENYYKLVEENKKRAAHQMAVDKELNAQVILLTCLE